MKERRASRRYELSLPIKIRIPAQTDAVTCNGKTRDISTGGVHFLIENDLNVGAELELTVTLPTEVTGGVNALVQAEGTVLRVEKGSGHVGVAALIRQYERASRRTCEDFEEPSHQLTHHTWPAKRQSAKS